MNGVRVKIAVFLVFVFGLTGCTSDKVKKKEDAWRLTAPEVVLPSRLTEVGGTRLSVAAASQRALPPDSELRFSSVEDVRLEVRSLCSRGEQTFAQNFNFPARTTLLLLSILPGQTFLNVDSYSELNCSFEFLATNSNLSTHQFFINGLKIRGAEEFSNLQTSAKLQPITDGKLIRVPIEDLDQLAVETKESSGGHAELICTDFIGSDSFDSIEKVVWKKLAYSQSPEVLQKVLQHFRQHCRIAVSDTFGIRNELSPEFEIEFPFPGVSVVTQTPVFNSHLTTSMAILTVTLNNTSDVDEYFSVPGDGQIAADAELVWGSARAQNFVINPNSMYATLSTEVNGAEVANSTYLKYLTVKANSTATVSIMVSLLYGNQFSNDIFSSHVQLDTVCAGYLFKLRNPVRLKRIESPKFFSGSVEPQAYDELQLFKTLPHHVDEMKVYVPTSQVANWYETARLISR